MDYRTYQNLRGYCWQDLSPYIDTKSSNDTLEIKRFIVGNRADIQHEHAAAMGLFQTSDLTPRERAAAHLLAMVSNHRATAWYREPVTPDGKPPAEPLEPWQASELWAQTRLAVTEYAAFIPEREALALLALVSEKNTAPEQEAATPVPVVDVAELVEYDEAVPVKGGLLTKEIAVIFDGLNDWDAKRWPKNLSASNWLRPARIALGGAGDASSVWNPLTLAQLLHDRTRGAKPKEKLMQSLKSRFSRYPALEPWRDDFNEYFTTFCTTD